MYNLSNFENNKLQKDVFKLIDETILASKNSKSLIDEESLLMSQAFNFPAYFLLSNPKKWKDML